MHLSQDFLISHALLGARPLGGFNGYAAAADPPPAIGDRRSVLICDLQSAIGSHLWPAIGDLGPEAWGLEPGGHGACGLEPGA